MPTPVRAPEADQDLCEPFAALARVGFFLMLLLACAVAAAFATAGAAQAREAKPPAFPVLVTPGDMRAGSLLLKGTEEGRYVEAPRLGTDIDLAVSGPTARA